MISGDDDLYLGRKKSNERKREKKKTKKKKRERKREKSNKLELKAAAKVGKVKANPMLLVFVRALEISVDRSFVRAHRLLSLV